MTAPQKSPPAQADGDDFVATHPASTKNAHIEHERAAYIAGDKAGQQESVRALWEFVSANPDQFRSPGHHSPSAPLHTHSLLDDDHCELLIRDTPGRHIYYYDSLDEELASAHVLVRLERKQKAKGVTLKEAFDEVTVKIGDKAKSRVEDSVRIDLAFWQRAGFWAALKAGMKADIEAVQREDGREAAQKRRKALNALKDSMIEAVGHRELKALEVFPLIHLKRNTIEAAFSPPADSQTILEIKTDLCDWVDMLSQLGHFGQFEVEGIAGNFAFVDQTLDEFCTNPAFGLTPTTDSKANQGFRSINPWIMPQNNSPAEVQRAAHNRAKLKTALDTIRFKALNAKDLGLIPAPANAAP